MFIERLTTEDLSKIFTCPKEDIVYEIPCSNPKEMHVYLHHVVDNSSKSVLSDFGATTITTDAYRKFMYEKFGKEYLSAYSKLLQLTDMGPYFVDEQLEQLEPNYKEVLDLDADEEIPLF